MAGELRLDQHLPGKLVDAYVWRDATQAEVWQVSEAAFAADSLYAREHGTDGHLQPDVGRPVPDGDEYRVGEERLQRELSHPGQWDGRAGVPGRGSP